MNSEHFDLLSGNRSSNHHYIPKFLLNGFKNSDGLLYVYDKVKNRILKNPRPSGSIFYEKDRNTIEINNTIISSIIEDRLFSKIDSDTSKVVKYYQQGDIEKLDFTAENNAMFEFFLINLFWRIPKTDYTAEDVMDRSIINSTGIDPEIIKRDPSLRKIYRASIFKHNIDEMIKNGKNVSKVINIHQSNNEVYVIGDYPILFRKTPRRFSEFGEIDFLVAVSSQRLYSSSSTSLKTTFKNSLAYNAAIISQSEKYVACADRNILAESIELHNEMMDKGLNYFETEVAFQNLA